MTPTGSRLGLIALLLMVAPSARGGPDQYAELIKATRQALAKNSLDEAADACRKAIREARGRAPLDEAKALELCGDVEMRRERHLEASRGYAEAARRARSDLKLRKKLLFRRKSAAERAKAENATALAKEVLEADRTLEQVMRRPRRAGESLEKTLSALAKAAKTYRRDRDRDRAEEALALRSLVMVRSQRTDDGLRAAERVVAQKPASRHAAAIAHEARAWALLEKNEDERAARAAIMFNHLRNGDLPEDRRFSVRAPLLDRACHRYEQKNGEGSCTRLEIELTGEPTFTDFSRGKRKRELSSDDIEKVHAQALPALEDCVLTAARKEKELYRNVDINVSWAIDREGRAIEIDLSPARNKQDILPCAEPRLRRLRYPKVVSNERKNVVIPYHLD